MTAFRRPLQHSRRPHIEKLECRRLLVAEGTPFDISQSVDITGISGTPRAEVDWGDGTTTTESVSGIGGAGPLNVKLDYRYDNTNFFGDQARRDLLQATIETVVSRFTDTLAAIRPQGTNRWDATFRDPRNGNRISITNPTIAANEIVIYVGARNMPGAQIGEGSFGGYSVSAQVSNLRAWENAVKARGEPGAVGDETSATDTGPWGGSIAFDTSAKWHFGETEEGLDFDENDFVSVAMHEFMHVLGFGSADSFDRLVTSTGFAGSRAKAVDPGSGNVAMNGDGHFADSVTIDGFKTLMNATIVTGTRTPLSRIDVAAMDDIGWTIADNTGTITASHTYADNGQFPIEIVLTGSEALSTKSYSRSANVTNVAPVLTVPGNQTAIIGQAVSLTNIGSIVDPGYRNTAASPSTNETFTYSIDWGDGSDPATGNATIDRIGSATRTTLASFNGSHTFSDPGAYTVRVTVTDDDGGSDSETFRFTTTMPPSLQLSINRSTIREDAGASAATLTVTRPASTSNESLVVNLSSSDTSELTLPTSVTFDEDETTATVEVAAVDDNLLDGPITTRITANATNFESDSVDVAVLDVESLIAELNRPSVSEDAAAALVLTLSRSNTDVDEALAVSFSGSNLSQLDLQSPLTIPAGRQTVQIPIPPVNDDVAELTKNVSMMLTAFPYANVQVEFSVLDDEAPAFQNQTLNFDVDGENGATAQDALLIINELNRKQGDVELDPEQDAFNGRWYDVNGDYLVSALDALLVINVLNRNATTAAASAETTLFAMASSTPMSSTSQSQNDEEQDSDLSNGLF